MDDAFKKIWGLYCVALALIAAVGVADRLAQATLPRRLFAVRLPRWLRRRP